jgi:hypothetical protein
MNGDTFDDTLGKCAECGTSFYKDEGAAGRTYWPDKWFHSECLANAIEKAWEQTKIALAALQQAQAAELERALRFGYAECFEHIFDPDGAVRVDTTPNAALAAWRAQQETKP